MKSSGITQSLLRAIQGAVASLGAPLGWLMIEVWSGVDPLVSLRINAGLYFYMLFATLIVFALFGYYVGAQEQLAKSLSFHDALTGVYNQRYFRARLAEEIGGAERHDQPLCLAIFDLDHFKRINDSYGHPIGDEMLRAVTVSAQDVIRKNDILARVGGEEFAILFPQCPADMAHAITNRIRESVKSIAIPVHGGEKVGIRISAGFGTYIPGDSLSEFYERIDKKLYAAKRLGRDRVISE